MEKLKTDAADILVCVRQLKALYKHNEKFEDNLAKRSQELELKEKDLRCLSFELEERCKIFEEEKAKSGDLKKLVEECNEDLRLKRNQLTTRLESLGRYDRELELKKKDMGQVMAELRRRCGEAREAEDRKRVIEGETYRKKKDLAVILDRIRESSKQLVTVDEQLESRQRQLETKSLEVVKKEKELECLRESIKLANFDIELKEGKVQLLNNCLTVCGEEIDSKSRELGEIQEMIEQQTSERDLIKVFVKEFSEELDIKVKRHKEISESIHRSSTEMEEKAKEIKAAETEASDLSVRSQRFRQEVEDKGNELALLKNQIESEEKKLVQMRREMEEETDRKKKDLVLISNKIEDKGQELDVLKNQTESKEEKLIQLKREMEERAREIKAAKIEATDLSVRSQRFRQEVEDKEKKLDLLKNQTELEENKLIQLKREVEEKTDRKKKDLELILNKIEESGKQLVAVDEQLESQKTLLKTQSEEIVSNDMELECLAESSKSFKSDIEVKEKRVQALNDLITISVEQLDLKSKELEGVQKLIEEQTKKLCDMQQQQPSINETSQQNGAETEPVNEDGLMHHESSAFLARHEVIYALRASHNPAELVLDLVQEEIRQGSCLEDSFAKNFILLFDELSKMQRPEESQLQLKATELATLWKGKITIEAPKSSLEALAFLKFIVAYGLKKLINQEETALLASSIAQYIQAPIVFNSLGLEPEMIPVIVIGLINKSHNIPSVRLICQFKLYEDFEPSHLLKKEIKSLKRSAESSQAKDKDAERLRAIHKLAADYDLKVNIPGDLEAKLMVQRAKSSSLARCSVTHLASSSNPQANSPDPASAQRSSVNLRVPKPEVKPYLN